MAVVYQVLLDVIRMMLNLENSRSKSKKKVIDQKYRARGSNLPDRKQDVPTHVGKVFKSRFDAPKDNEGGSGGGGNDDK